MALTDNNFEEAEMEAALAANPALKDRLLASVTKLGYKAQTQVDYDTALNTAIGTKTSELYTGLDNDIFAASGVAKEGAEKTYDYAKRVIGSLKSAPGTLQTEIDRLKTEIAKGSGDATLKAQLAALQEEQATWKTDVATLNQKLFDSGVAHSVDKGLLGLKFDPTVKESVRNVLVENAKAQIVAMAKVQQNADKTEQIVFVRDGKTILKKDNTPAEAADVLSELLKDVLDAGHGGQGGGQSGDDPNKGGAGPDGNVQVPDARPADVKTKMAVDAWLLRLGVKKGTKQFDDEYRKHAQGLPLQ